MILKKTVFLLAFLTLLFSIYSYSYADEDGVTFASLPNDHPIKNAEIFQENERLQPIFLYPNESFNEEEALAIVQSVDKLPKEMLQRINEKGIHIKLFTGSLTDNRAAEDLKDEQPRGYINEKTTWDDVPGMGGGQTVLVKIGASDKGEGHGSVNLELHELAHSIDKIVYEAIRHDPVFLSIWQAETESLFPGMFYFEEYPEEYFAEAFAMFYVNETERDRLKKWAPKTYLYIKQLN
jgi:Pro-Pro endopeptidase